MIDRLVTTALCLPLVALGTPLAAWLRSGDYASGPLRAAVAVAMLPGVVGTAPLGAWAMAGDLVTTGDGKR